MSKVKIIAEAGNCHEGDLNIAIRMIKKAHQCGADYVKFQAIRPENLLSTEVSEDRLTQLKKWELSESDIDTLLEVGSDIGCPVFFSVFDFSTVHFLKSKTGIFKISSGDNQFWPLIIEAVKASTQLYVSLGNVLDLEQYLKDFNYYCGKSIRESSCQVTFLHCVSLYPTPSTKLSLGKIKHMYNLFDGFSIGYSDHFLSNEAAVASVLLGAKVIERHFTLDNNQSDFRDHKLASNPTDFEEFVRKVRLNEEFLIESKATININATRSLAFSRDLRKGSKVSMQDITMLRPGHGLEWKEVDSILGKVVVKDVFKRELIRKSDLKDLCVE